MGLAEKILSDSVLSEVALIAMPSPEDEEVSW